jgi:hypothetical protein
MGVIGAVDIAFSIWYDGNASPLSSAEAASLLVGLAQLGRQRPAATPI